jgi:hypothetical protein
MVIYMVGWQYRSSPLVVWKGKPEFSERNEVVPLHGTQHTVDRMRNTGRAILIVTPAGEYQ